MAITPEQARVGPNFRLTEDEHRRVWALEDEIDSQLAISAAGREGKPIGIGMSISAPIGSLTPAMQASLVGRYRTAGWTRVILSTHENNYSIHLNAAENR